GALIFDRGRILMAQRGKEPLKGWWSLPGGALEVGESLDFAVRREVRDETGASEYHYVLIDYICRVTGGTLCAGDDVCRVEWVNPGGLKDLQITEGTLGVIEKAFRSDLSRDREKLSRDHYGPPMNADEHG